ncbi:Protein RTF1-like protein [Dichanthelium oligosanthes]|uniref:Protein RTF1-like protein n=1 Tax=Dichanthelium oligosanthes TaxID=888268 RepID=A0A1E5WKZ4_9POAL|nr:Protein RTF1-like protein [Dichanthelium oligosanthes]
MSDPKLDDLLLQAAGRTGKSQSRPRNPRWQSGGSGSDGFDDDSDSDAAPTVSRKKPPSQQVPLKKRHQPEKGGRRGGGGGGWRGDDDEEDDDEGRRSGGEDSDSAPSVGSDLYKDEDDKEKLEKMSELEREMILADRSTRIDDYKLKQMARASSSKMDKAGARKDSSPPPPPSRMRSSTRTDKSGSATKSALDELRAKRMRQQDPEAHRNRFKDLLPQSSSPSRRRAGSPPSDGSNDGDNRGRQNDHGRIADDGRDDEFDESPSRLDPLKFDDVKSITLRRSKLVKWFMEPFFEDLMTGCFVRLGIGKTKSGIPRYRLCIVRNVDASDPHRKYNLESYTTCKYLNVVWDSEANAARWQMTQVSDSPPNEEEFKEWLQEAEKNSVRIPTRQEVLEKKEEIQNAYNYVYSARTVQEMLQKKSAVRRPINVAAEKDRLRNELEIALSRRNEAEAERIRARLNKLQNTSKPISKNDKAAKLEAMNRKNRAENFKNASEMKPVNTSLKAGEAGYDPFSRRWTRSRNYYAAKPGGDNAEEAANGSNGNAVAGNEDVRNKSQTGTAATAAAQVAAADAGKLIDTNAPVDLGTESNAMHTFELPISLSALQEFGGAKGLFDGYMARKQKIEATMGYKVPDNDGRRHALTLSVSDYKRRRGLL